MGLPYRCQYYWIEIDTENADIGRRKSREALAQHHGGRMGFLAGGAPGREDPQVPPPVLGPLDLGNGNVRKRAKMLGGPEKVGFRHCQQRA